MGELKTTMNTHNACFNKEDRQTKIAQIINPFIYLNKLKEYFK